MCTIVCEMEPFILPSSSLTEHLASGKTMPRATAKQMPYAKLLLRKMDNRV